MRPRAPRLGPTSADLLDASSQPYFLWWTDVTVGELHRKISTGTDDERAYWIGALLREANSRDVWLFVQPEDVRALWPSVLRHLGRTRAMWAWLLGMPDAPWPPVEARRA